MPTKPHDIVVLGKKPKKHANIQPLLNKRILKPMNPWVLILPVLMIVILFSLTGSYLLLGVGLLGVVLVAMVRVRKGKGYRYVADV